MSERESYDFTLLERYQDMENRIGDFLKESEELHFEILKKVSEALDFLDEGKTTNASRVLEEIYLRPLSDKALNPVPPEQGRGR